MHYVLYILARARACVCVSVCAFNEPVYRVLCKIFGAMSSDSFVMDCIFFGLKPIEELICARQNRFVTRYISSENTVYMV